jgi:hypothetical protein
MTSGKAQFSSRGLKLVAAAALAGILLLLAPVGIGLLERGIGGGADESFTPREGLGPVACAGMLCVPLFLSLRALKRGTLREKDSGRLLVFIPLLTVLAVGIATITIIIGGILVAGVFL